MSRKPPMVDQARQAISMLAPLFLYPRDDYAFHLDLAREAASGADSDADRSLDRFGRAIAEVDLPTLETVYTRTFDLGASCLPYLGAHLFDPESRDRARLMVGLRMTYRNSGYESEGELPDHIAEVLRFTSGFDVQEWSELVRLVLVPALTKMEKILESTTNPFRHLVSATGDLCRAAAIEGGAS